ncbi:hypothetical protein SBA4_5450009 [Candidatus Sulfopaludibacter sp. SbA4]|nr:hypothetical protein SBA4_5450009 [Candidatus Sulfopaludibacter sp. SbA4]
MPLPGVADTLTVAERIPASESTTFGGWYDPYGFPTAAFFNMTLSDLPMFGGRQVLERNPVAGDTIPQGFAGNDGCWWSTAPWSATQFTALAQPAAWYVQLQNGSSVYGPDKVGFSPNTVGYMQHYAPALQGSGSSCVIQYPQVMAINKEQARSATPETYGAANTGFNLLTFTFTATSVLVSRAGASDSSFQTYHF